MVKAPEGNPYNSLSHTVACRITGCKARIIDPVLHERIFHWGKPVCECQVCVLSRKQPGKKEEKKGLTNVQENEPSPKGSVSLSDWV